MAPLVIESGRGCEEERYLSQATLEMRFPQECVGGSWQLLVVVVTAWRSLYRESEAACGAVKSSFPEALVRELASACVGERSASLEMLGSISRRK
jgi:hypothetical protein